MFNLDNLKIRTKLILLLFVPVVALLLFASVGWNQRNATAARATTDKHIVEAAAATSELVTAMEHEAVATVAVFAGVSEDGHLDELQAVTDEASKRFRDVNAALDFGGDSEADNAASAALATLDTTLGDLEAYRSVVAPAEGAAWFRVVENYRNNSINRFVDYVQTLARLTTTPEVVLPLEQLAALLDYNLQTTALASIVSAVDSPAEWDGPSGSEDDGATVRAATHAIASDQDKKNAVLRRVAGPDGSIGRYFKKNVSLPSGLAVVFDKQWKIPPPLDAASFTLPVEAFAAPEQRVPLSEVQEYVTAYSGATAEVTEQTVVKIDKQRSDAVGNARLYVLLGGLAIIAAIAAAIVITVSITKRLAKLTEAADRLSHEQLPRLVDSLKNPAEDDVGYLTSSFTEIDVTGSDEIGQLAGAFNRIQGVAVDVATEQAQLLRKGIGDMFVNLARRNQSLLDRQIEFIDELEAAEEDPDQLENLFRLDHLATRMRRNAESLLVLAGAEPSRRRGRPVPLADVVRAAVGEVEDFARIDMLQFDEVLVASNAALDIAHVLSELMENAANFSPPDTRVEVVGHRTKAEGYVISVTDHGIGMTQEAIAESNDLLARPPLVGLALSRSLGFIVIGRLAARFGIAVRLMPSPSGGTTAMVSLPPTLITEQPQGSSGPGELPRTTERPPVPPATDDTSALASGTDRRPAPRTGSTPPAGRPRPTERPRSPERPGPESLPGGGTGAGRAMPRRRPATAEPLPGRTPAPTARTAPPPAPSAPPRAPAAPGVRAPDAAVDSTTASGLTKRLPRRAGGQRAVPGGDGSRAATQNRRSPEEVRSMLSRYRSGMQKGRGDDEVSGVPPDPTTREGS